MNQETKEVQESSGKEPGLRPVGAAAGGQSIQPKPYPLYPTADSLDEVVALARQQFPIELHNQLHVLLMTYHNTLLSQA